MREIDDGGPAFPHEDTGSIAFRPGMSKRELFAAILMHSEAVTCGVPGEACEALVEASRAAGTDVIDHMAMNAARGADALLRALALPKVREPEPIPPHLTYHRWATPAAEHAAIKRIARQPDFAELPEFLRKFVSLAVERIDDEDDLPF